MTTLNDFLAAFFPDINETICLRFFKPRAAPSSQDNQPVKLALTRASLSSDVRVKRHIRDLNRTRGAYFAVNSGGDKDADITRCNAFFVEHDDLSIVEQHAALDRCPLAPSVRVETRKSVHAYWLIEGGVLADEWREVQERLIAYFHGDAKIKNPSRVMRLPFFNHLHYAPETGEMEAKRVEVAVFDAERRYTLADMQAAFPAPAPSTPPNASSEDAASNTHAPDDASFATWDELNAELKRRIMRQAKQNGRDIFEMRGICHNGNSETALMFNPATGKVHCNNKCEYAAILRAFGLPELPQSTKGTPKNKPPSRFRFTTLNDLLDEPEEQIGYVWERTLPCGGFSICAAKPKVGKSTLARNLAVAVSRGAEFFGRATAQGKVIYLCLEEKRAEVGAHFRRMGACGDKIIIHTGRTPDDALEALEAAIEEHAPALVIIDPLSRFVRVTDFNSYGEVTRGLEPLIDLARATDAHIQAVHHNGKGEREGGDALLGSTGFFGAVDALLVMRKRERVRTLETVQRYGEDIQEIVVHMDAETGLVTPGGDLTALQIDEHKAKVLEALGGDALTESEVRERAGGNQSLVSKALRALHESGDLQRTGAGKRGDAYRYEKSLVSRFSLYEEPRNQENRETDAADDALTKEELSEREQLAAQFQYYGASRAEADATARRMYQATPF